MEDFFSLNTVFTVINNSTLNERGIKDPDKFLGIIQFTTGTDIRNIGSSRAAMQALDACKEEVLRQHPSLRKEKYGIDLQSCTRADFETDIIRIASIYGARFRLLSWDHNKEEPSRPKQTHAPRPAGKLNHDPRFH